MPVLRRSSDVSAAPPANPQTRTLSPVIRSQAYGAERTARFKKYRLLVHVAGRMNRNNCVMRLRLCATEQTIARLSAVWEVFQLATRASRTRPWPRAGYA